MELIRTLIVLLCLTPLATPSLERIDRDNSRLLPSRILQLMINYNDRTVKRIQEITAIRAKYEETPHFELGFITSEILERYRKMVVQVRKPIDYVSDTLFETIKQTELTQKLFLEIYHLVNMANEVPRKFGHLREFVDDRPYDAAKVEEANMKIMENKRNRERERKKRMKEMRKERQLYMKGEIKKLDRKSVRPKNKWWPIDYGWEIDYYWR